jgi:hypothetical protein
MIDLEQFPYLRQWYPRFHKACPDDPGFVKEPANHTEEALHAERFLAWCRQHTPLEDFAALKQETLRAFLWDSE